MLIVYLNGARIFVDSALEVIFRNTWQNSILRNNCPYLTLLSGWY